MSENKNDEVDALQEERMSMLSKKADELMSAKGIDAYLEKRWMTKYIKEIGCPILYDTFMYKFLAIFVVSFISLFFLGKIMFLVFFVATLSLFGYEFWDRIKTAKLLIKELAGHDNTANFLHTFVNSHYTEEMAEWMVKNMKEHTRDSIQIRNQIDVLEKTTIEKNIIVAQDKKELLFKQREKLVRMQPLFVLAFCMHMYRIEPSRYSMR